MQLETIAKKEQKSAISSFWTMLQECESKAIADNDVVLRHLVDAWYKQWNRITGDNKISSWKR